MDRMMNMLMDLVSQLTNLAVALVGVFYLVAIIFNPFNITCTAFSLKDTRTFLVDCMM